MVSPHGGTFPTQGQLPLTVHGGRDVNQIKKKMENQLLPQISCISFHHNK